MSTLEQSSSSLQSLNDKKEKGYIILLCTQVLCILYSIVLFQFFLRSDSVIIKNSYSFIFALVGMAYTWCTYTMIRHFSKNTNLIRFTFIIFLISFWTGIIISNPLDPMDQSTFTYKLLGTINQAGSFVAFLFMMVFMVRDIFAEQHTILYRLWGSASIYFNIGIIFSFVYGLINLHGANELAPGIFPDFTGYIHCMNYSFYTLAALDSPYTEVGGLFRSVAVIQSLLANLYIVLLIGRILSK